MFVDIHSHIIPGIDDGAADQQTTVKMLRISAECGTRHIIATPHIIPGSYDNSQDIVIKSIKKLKKMVESEGIDIALYPGSEAFISPDLPKLVKSGIITTLNKTSFILVELPMAGIPPYTEDVLYQLQLNGLTPILAHPERNNEAFREFERFHSFLDRGILFQINSGSITGIYGRFVQKNAMKFIKNGYAHFVASDSHTVHRRSPNLTKASKIINDAFGTDVMVTLFRENGLKVLRNEKSIVRELCSSNC